MKDRHKNRPAHNFIDLTGKRFGRLLVVRDSGIRKSRRPIWECICDCGKTVNIQGKYLLCGDTHSCGCLKLEPAHNRDSCGEITASFWTPIVTGARARGIPFEVTRQQALAIYIAQDGLCALSGVPIRFSSNVRDTRSKQTASLDRIDSGGGYTIDNIQWVHKKINIMKSSLDVDEFYAWCVRVNNWLTPKYNEVGVVLDTNLGINTHCHQGFNTRKLSKEVQMQPILTPKAGQ